MSHPLQQAAIHLRAGEKGAARTVLVDFIRQNPNSEDGWMMLSLTLTDPKQLVDCYKRVLSLNPNNTEARDKLNQITQPLSPPPGKVKPFKTDALEDILSSPGDREGPGPLEARERAPTVPQPPATKAVTGAPVVPAASDLNLPAEVSEADKVKPFDTGSLEETEAILAAPNPAASPAPTDKVKPFETGALEETSSAPAAPTPGTDIASFPTAEPVAPPTVAIEVASPLDVEWRPDQDVPVPQRLSYQDWDRDEINSAILMPASRQRVPGRQPRPARPTEHRLLIVTGLIAVLIVTLGLTLAAYGFLARQAQATQAAATQQMSIALATVPTLPPTWTVTPTPTITLTPTITSTPTSTSVPTPLSPDPEIAANMDTLQQEVADVRGLAVRGDVQRYVIDQKHVRGTLEELFLNHGGSREEVADSARVLSALGLIKPTYDLFTNTLNGISDGIGGFYTPWTKQLYVIGEEWTGVERLVYSHEYDHALTDAYFDIAGMGVYPDCLGDEQRCDAIRALVEGDATLLMALWLRQYATPQDKIDVQRLAYQRGSTTLPEQFPPPYAIQNALFPYREGLLFVEHLHTKGNWAAVNNAYRNLPQSTEQILHPEKYEAGEGPQPVSVPSLAGAIGAEWRLLKTNSLGEWLTFLMLSYGADLAAQIDDTSGAAAAAGWGGDAYQVYYNDGDGSSLLAVHWVWDTPADADQFKAAMLDYQNERFRGARVIRDDGDCWEANNQASCIFTTGQETLWLLAPNQTILNDVLARYPNFP